MTWAPPRLRELQESLASLILSPSKTRQPDGIFRVPPGHAVVDRLQVYVGGYPARLSEALAETFPAVMHLLSCSGTTGLAERYIGACPPLSYNLNDAGARLPEFLRADELSIDLPFLADLADLEWCLACAFHAPREVALDPPQVAARAPEAWAKTVLSFQPGVAVIASPWPIHDIWAVRATPIEEIDLDLVDRPQTVLVYRLGPHARCEVIEPEEGRVIAALMAGRVLGEALDVNVAPEQLGEWFSRWTGFGLLVSVEAPRIPSPL